MNRILPPALDWRNGLVACLLLLFVSGLQAQYHSVKLHGTDERYSCIAETQDGTSHSLVASTWKSPIDPNPQVSITRLKDNGNLDWSQEYFYPGGWRASHIITKSASEAFLLGVTRPDTNGTPVRSLLLPFNPLTGAASNVMEIKDVSSPGAFEDGLVLLHGIHRDGKLILAGWLGGPIGVDLVEQRTSLLMEINVPTTSQSYITPNWTYGTESFSPQFAEDYDMASHVVDVPGEGYFLSGSGNAFFENPQLSGYHQAPLAAFVLYDGTPVWSKVVPYWFPGEGDNHPIVNQPDRHGVAAAAAVINLGSGSDNIFELVQVVNWTANRGLTTLRHRLDGSFHEAKGLHLDGAYTFPFAETSLKGYSIYRKLNANAATELIIGGYVNDPDYLNSDPDTQEKDRVPFLMHVDIEGNNTGTYLLNHSIFTTPPTENYGDDPGIHAANSQSSQQPIIFHPEMMDLRESVLGYSLVAHRNTQIFPKSFDVSVLGVDNTLSNPSTPTAGAGCDLFQHPMTLEIPYIDPFTVSVVQPDVEGLLKAVDPAMIVPEIEPCVDYHICDVELTTSVTAVNCSTYTITAANAGSTPMADLDLSFNVLPSAAIEQSGVADGSDGSGNPSFTSVYPVGSATTVVVAMECGGVTHTQEVIIEPDCGSGSDCPTELDYGAALTSVSQDVCGVGYTVLGIVTPVADASIDWTLDGAAVPAASGQWTATFDGTVTDFSGGPVTIELCATITCADGTTLTECLDFTLTLEAFGLPTVDLLLFCGNGCSGGIPGTRAGITFNQALFDLSEADYDAEVCFNDGTTMPIALGGPGMSLLKCFSGYSFLKEACLKIYEEGNLAAGLPPCYETCDRETCLELEPVPFDLAEALLPELAINASTCSIESGGLPESIDSRTELRVFNSLYPGGGSAEDYYTDFALGADFAGMGQVNFYSDSAVGSYQVSACSSFLEADITHPVLVLPEGAAENGLTEEVLIQLAQAQGITDPAAARNAIVIGEQSSLQITAALITDGPVDILAQANQQPQVTTDGIQPWSDEAEFLAPFNDPVLINPSQSDLQLNDWAVVNSLLGQLQWPFVVTPSGDTALVDNEFPLIDNQDPLMVYLPSETDDITCPQAITLVPPGSYYDHGVLGMASQGLAAATSIPIAEVGQLCPQNLTYLSEAVLELYTPVVEGEDEYPMGEWTPEDGEEYPMGEWTPQEETDGGEDEYPMGEWSPNVIWAESLVTDWDINDANTGASFVDVTIDYYDGYGDGGITWYIADEDDNVVATGSMPNLGGNNTPSYANESLQLAPGSYEFHLTGDCFTAEDNSAVQLTSGNLTYFNLAPGTLSPGSLVTSFYIPPGSFIPPAFPVPLDTTCDALFSHDLMPLGLLNAPIQMTTVASENNMDLALTTLYVGSGVSAYGNAMVVPAVPTFGDQHVLKLRNIMAVYDLSAFSNVSEVTFAFLDDAGIQNLRVNGSSLLTGDLETMTSNVAPGVTMSVSTVSHPGYQTGVVTLTGDVHTLSVGGQELLLDHICVKSDTDLVITPQNDPTDCNAFCDAFTDFEGLTFGDRYGDFLQGATIGHLPGDLLTTSDGLSISLDVLTDSYSGTTFNYLEVAQFPLSSGPNKAIFTNNVTAVFDIADAVDVTDTVCLSFVDLGGFENFSINGSLNVVTPSGYGGLWTLSGSTIGGVEVQVTGTSITGGYAGLITLIGDVDVLIIGGQELWLDDLCISADVADEPACDVTAAFGVAELEGDCNFAFAAVPSDALFQWSKDGNPLALATLPYINLGFTPGEHEVCLTATDPDDASCTATQCMTVSCDDPQAGDCDVEFTHELMTPGGVAIPGAGVTVATEDGIDLSFDDIVYGTGSTNFGSADIIPAQPEAGDGQVMWLNNITAVYDLSSVGTVDMVKFEFIDYGGGENLRINGALLIDDITDMNGAVLGGVNVFVAWNTYTGFKAGEVVLTGNVQELAVAGQEFYIDNVCVIAGEEPACADTDADGICDADEIAGCTDPSADNYNPSATDDDGSCFAGYSSSDCDVMCDYTTDFDSDLSGSSWGDPAAGASVAVAEGDLAFTSGDVDVYAIPTLESSIPACGDPLYQFMTTETAGVFGSGRVLRLNNIGARFDIQSAVPETDTVCVAYRYAGNLRVFAVNTTTACNSPGPSISGYHNTVIGGCLLLVDEVLETTANGSVVGASGTLTIIGDVNTLEFGGDEVWVDDLCISASEGGGCTEPTASNYDPNATVDDGSCDDGSTTANDTTEIITPNGIVCPVDCDWLVDFESRPLGDRWGATNGVPQGSYMYTDNGIDLYVDELNSALYGITYVHNEVTVSPWAAFGAGQVLHTNNATVTFDLDSITTDSICLDILDFGGFEVLEVNGARFSSFNGYGELAGAPLMMGGVLVQVIGNPIIQNTSTGPQTVGFNGRLVLHGDVDKLEIGGQEFWIDNLCIAGATPAATLADAFDEQGEDGILEMFNLSIDIDSANCQMAVAYLVNPDLPDLNSAQFQLLGLETGTTYFQYEVEDTPSPYDFDANDSSVDQGIDLGFAVFLAQLPETDEPLVLQLYLEDFTTTLVIEVPGFIPGCGGGVIDLPCLVDATFIGFEIECGVVSIIAPPAVAGAGETWTLNGAPYVPTGDPHAFTIAVADGLATTLCRTVVDPNIPDCEDTFCLTFVADCTPDTCDYSFTHELMAMGPVPTSTFFVEDHIVMHTAAFDDGLGGPPSIGGAWIDLTAVPGVGDNQVLLLSNTNAHYDLGALVNVDQVTVEYFDGAGIENLMINGSFMIDEFGDLAGSSFTHGGVDVFITRAAGTGYHYGEVIMTGNVNQFAIGGQQFFVDNVCVSAEGVDCTTDTDQDGVCDEDEVAGCTHAGSINYDPNATDDDGSCDDGSTTANDTTEIITPNGIVCPVDCDWLVDFEARPLGDRWGATNGIPQGSYMYTDNGIDLYVDELNSALYGITYVHNEVTVSPWAAFGAGQVLHTNNAMVTFDLDSVTTDSVCLDILDFGGFEVLEVNGVSYSSFNGYGELAAAPLMLGGVQVQVIGNPIIQNTSTGPQTVGFNGRLVLHGNVDKLKIGGQEFWVDNLCIGEGAAITPIVPGCTYEGAGNYDADANLDDGSCILPGANSCPTDINGDGITSVPDLLELLGQFSAVCDD